MKTKQDFDQAFPVQVELPVQWGEMDAFGHVNNTVYFKYFETARLTYFNEVGVMEDMQQEGIGPILAETSCRFKRALKFPDQIIVGASVLENQEFGFLMKYGIYSSHQQTVTSVGTGRIVMVNYHSGSKVKPSEKLLQLIAKIQKQ